MFNFRKKTNNFVTVRAEDLRAGDQFVHNHIAVKVMEIIPNSTQVQVVFNTTHESPGTRQFSKDFDNGQMIRVAR